MILSLQSALLTARPPTVAPHSPQACELYKHETANWYRNCVDCSSNLMIHSFACIFMQGPFFGYYKFMFKDLWSAFAFTRSCMGNVITSPSWIWIWRGFPMFSSHFHHGVYRHIGIYCEHCLLCCPEARILHLSIASLGLWSDRTPANGACCRCSILCV